jgi:hypothetical protein
MKTLDEIGLNYYTDKASYHHKYLDYYDTNLSAKRNNENNILEIGILFGQSTKMFKEYFTNSKIYSFDIEDKRNLAEDRIEILYSKHYLLELI